MEKIINVIPHSIQRYATVGDYKFIEDDKILFTISKMDNDDYEFLVSIHELIEEHLTRRRGLTEQEITAFDLEFKKSRGVGDESEAGFDKDCPYLKEHTLATSIEMMLAAYMGISWEDYNDTVNSL